MSAFLELCLAGLALTAGLEAGRAFDSAASGFERTEFTLLLVLTTLALAEHVFLILPLQEARLWRWAFPPAERNLVSSSLDAPEGPLTVEPNDNKPSAAKVRMVEKMMKGAPAHGL